MMETGVEHHNWNDAPGVKVCVWGPFCEQLKCLVCICLFGWSPLFKVTPIWYGIYLSSWGLMVLLRDPTVLGFVFAIIQSVAQGLNCSVTTSSVCHAFGTVFSFPYCNIFFFLHRIEEELGDKAHFAGRKFRNPLNWDRTSDYTANPC